jgi:amino acid adenylation domain-containing protein
LLAGAGYVPLDPELPCLRLAQIAVDAELRFVLADSKDEHSWIPAGTALLSPSEAESAGPLKRSPRVRPAQCAYVIFTSGSTGTPKGVVVRHASVVNLIEWVNRTFGVGASDRVLFVTSLAFDLSVYDVFGLLAAGGSIRVASSHEVREPQSLVRRLLEDPVTFWDSAPAALQQLVPFFPPSADGPSPALRLVFLSGDWIPVTLPDQVRTAFARAEVVALGGATEATVWSNSLRVGEVDPRWVSIPYGRPIQGARYLILDESHAPCPIGVPGDLHIGGICLASCYSGEAALTADRFAPDPFGDAAGGRLYRTGDRARFWPDGRIEFLGRLDGQVKIRGFRVELGEVEAALLRHPSVRDAVALAREDRRGDRHLVAYLTARGGHEIHVEELRCFVADQLPEPMLPAAFVVLAELPVTANGKLDRRALPQPDLSEASGGTAVPSGPIEELIAGLWAEVLGVRSVGLRDDFFRLGGHSLRATQVVSRIRETFGVELPVRSVFEAPTVAELAQRVASARRDGAAVPPVERLVDRHAAPLSFTQMRLWFLDRVAAGGPAYQIPFAVRCLGQFDLRALEAALAELVRRHESLRTVFRDGEDEPVQVVAAAGCPTLVLADLSGLAEEARDGAARALVLQQVQSPFDLARGPLLRVAVVRLAAREHVLVMVLHHIVSDGWSMGILISELTRAYAALVEGRPLSLAALPHQYVDYAFWQRRVLSSEVLPAQLEYWRRHLAGAPETLDLPRARQRSRGAGPRGGAEHLVLSRELSEAVRRLSRQEGATLFMTLLAGFEALLHLYSGAVDLVVGTNVANRHRGEFEGVIGAFVNTLALRSDLTGNPTFRELLGRVREVVLEGYAHQDVSFEQVLEHLRPERAPDAAPLFQVMVVPQDLPEASSLALPGLTLHPVDLERRLASFDLTLFLYLEREAFAATLEYNAALYEAADVRRLLDHFAGVLQKAVDDPGARLSELSPARTAVAGFSEDLEEETVHQTHSSGLAGGLSVHEF